jgi:hypothetical protein
VEAEPHVDTARVEAVLAPRLSSSSVNSVMQITHSTAPPPLGSVKKRSARIPRASGGASAGREGGPSTSKYRHEVR